MENYSSNIPSLQSIPSPGRGKKKKEQKKKRERENENSIVKTSVTPIVTLKKTYLANISVVHKNNMLICPGTAENLLVNK